MQLLIIRKVDIEVRDGNNRTTLHHAVCNNSTEVAQLLVTHKADIEGRDVDSRTLLHPAAQYNSTKLINF